VIPDAVFFQVGEVAVPRPENVLQVIVSPALGISVVNDQGNGGACCQPLEYSGQNLNLVRFLAGALTAPFTRPPPVQIFLDIRPIQFQAGGAAVNDCTDSGPM